MVGEDDRVRVEGRLPGVRLGRERSLPVVDRRRQHVVRRPVGVGVDLVQQAEVEEARDRDREALRGLDVDGERPQPGEGTEAHGVPQPVLLERRHRERDDLPRRQRADPPPDRQVPGVGEGEAVRRRRIVLVRPELCGQRDADALAIDVRLARPRDAPDHLRQPVATGARQQHRVLGRVRLEGVLRAVEQQLDAVPGVLVEGRHLVLLVRAPVRDAEGVAVRVQRHVEQQQVEQHRGARRDLLVVRVLDQRQQRVQVVLVVDVRVPLAEAEARAQLHPAQQALARDGVVLAPLRPSLAKVRSGQVWPARSSSVWKITLVVLGPVVRVVDHAGRGRLGVPVLEGEQRGLDFVREAGRQRRVVAVAEEHVQELQRVEVARVLERRHLGEARVPGVGRHRRRRDGESLVDARSLEVRDDAHRASWIEALRREAQVREAPLLNELLVDEAAGGRRARRVAAAGERERRTEEAG
ncbi:MAG: hypothetical protein AB1689_15530, partial [Thermodesulfobacteriota bacterium]